MLLIWEGLGAGGEGDNRGWDGWMAWLTRWTWVWVNSGSWWWTGRPGVLRFMGLQRVGHDWETELNWIWEEVTLECPENWSKAHFCFVHLFGKKTKNCQHFCVASVFFHWRNGLIRNCDRLWGWRLWMGWWSFSECVGAPVRPSHCVTAGAVDTAQSSLLEGKTVLLTGRSVFSKEIQIPSSTWLFGITVFYQVLLSVINNCLYGEEWLLFWCKATWLSVEAGLPLFLVRYLFCFYWSVITLQCCVSFCCTTVWISSLYAYISSLWVSLPLHPASQPSGHHRALSRAPGAAQRRPTRCLFHMWQRVYISAALSVHPTLSFPSVSTSPFFLSVLWYLFPGGRTWHSVGQALVMKPYVTGSWPFMAICHLGHLVRFSFAVGKCSEEIRCFSDLEGNNHLKTIYKRE